MPIEKDNGVSPLQGYAGNRVNGFELRMRTVPVTIGNIFPEAIACEPARIRLMTHKPERILVVDDDAELRALLKRFLGEHGFQVRLAQDGGALDRELDREPADLVVLDLMMPGEDGLTITRRLRAAGETVPILILTAKGDPIDRVLGLEMGADDYLAKPFTPRELVARIAAILRRARPEGPLAPEQAITFGEFTLHPGSRRLLRGTEDIMLSTREFSILSALAAARGRALSRANLVERGIGRDAEVTDRAVDVAITRLRRAIGDDPKNPRWIRTVWGVGYQLAKEGECD